MPQKSFTGRKNRVSTDHTDRRRGTYNTRPSTLNNTNTLSMTSSNGTGNGAPIPPLSLDDDEFHIVNRTNQIPLTKDPKSKSLEDTTSSVNLSVNGTSPKNITARNSSAKMGYVNDGGSDNHSYYPHRSSDREVLEPPAPISLSKGKKKISLRGVAVPPTRGRGQCSVPLHSDLPQQRVTNVVSSDCEDSNSIMTHPTDNNNNNNNNNKDLRMYNQRQVSANLINKEQYNNVSYTLSSKSFNFNITPVISCKQNISTVDDDHLNHINTCPPKGPGSNSMISIPIPESNVAVANQSSYMGKMAPHSRHIRETKIAVPKNSSSVMKVRSDEEEPPSTIQWRAPQTTKSILYEMKTNNEHLIEHVGYSKDDKPELLQFDPLQFGKIVDVVHACTPVVQSIFAHCYIQEIENNTSSLVSDENRPHCRTCGKAPRRFDTEGTKDFINGLRKNPKKYYHHEPQFKLSDMWAMMEVPFGVDVSMEIPSISSHDYNTENITHFYPTLSALHLTFAPNSPYLEELVVKERIAMECAAKNSKCFRADNKQREGADGETKEGDRRTPLKRSYAEMLSMDLSNKTNNDQYDDIWYNSSDDQIVGDTAGRDKSRNNTSTSKQKNATNSEYKVKDSDEKRDTFPETVEGDDFSKFYESPVLCYHRRRINAAINAKLHSQKARLTDDQISLFMKKKKCDLTKRRRLLREMRRQITESANSIIWYSAETPEKRLPLFDQIQLLSEHLYPALMEANNTDLTHNSWFAVLWRPVYSGFQKRLKGDGSFLMFYAVRPPRHLFRPEQRLTEVYNREAMPKEMKRVYASSESDKDISIYLEPSDLVSDRFSYGNFDEDSCVFRVDSKVLPNNMKLWSSKATCNILRLIPDDIDADFCAPIVQRRDEYETPISKKVYSQMRKLMGSSENDPFSIISSVPIVGLLPIGSIPEEWYRYAPNTDGKVREYNCPLFLFATAEEIVSQSLGEEVFASIAKESSINDESKTMYSEVIDVLSKVELRPFLQISAEKEEDKGSAADTSIAVVGAAERQDPVAGCIEERTVKSIRREFDAREQSYIQQYKNINQEKIIVPFSASRCVVLQSSLRSHDSLLDYLEAKKDMALLEFTRNLNMNGTSK
eukprot:Tbor_TRINITY_DN5862_c1_g2::TRINITY_DN5862_c1_g2_i1::g.7012::m.7012